MKYYTLQITRTVLCEGQKAYPGTPAGIAGYALEYCYGRDLWREQAFLVFLGPKNEILGNFLLGVGGFSSVPVDKRLACIAVLGANVPKAVLVHNHPAGNPAPGQSDYRQTQEIKRAFDAIGCQLVDHIVLGEDSFFSFADEVVAPYKKF